MSTAKEKSKKYIKTTHNRNDDAAKTSRKTDVLQQIKMLVDGALHAQLLVLHCFATH